MQIDLTNILLEAGKTEVLEGAFSISFIKINGETFPVTEQSSLQVSVTHCEKQIIKVDAHCVITVAIPCARCLESVLVPLEIHVNQEIDMKKTKAEQIEGLDECDYIEGKVLDVDKLMYHEIIVSWPLQVLCKEDCKGICPECGCNRNLTSCECDTVVLDPRMAVVRDIFTKFKEEV